MTTQPTPSTVPASVNEPLAALLFYQALSLRYGEPGYTDEAAIREGMRLARVFHDMLTIPGSAEQASKAEPAQCMFREGSIRCYKYAGEFSDFCPDHTPAPTPKAEPATIKDYIDSRIQDAANALDRAAIKAGEHIGDTTEMIPWPKDLNELVGKRITQRAKPRHRDIMGDAPESGVVLSVISTDTLDVRKCVDGDDDQWTIDYRDLLSIEPMPTPKPADEGKVEGEWLPNGMYAFDCGNTCAVLYHDDVRERDSQWRAVVREQTRLMQQASTMGLQLQESINRLARERDEARLAMMRPITFHTCADGKVIPYPSLVCSRAMRHAHDGKEDFDAVEEINRLRAENQRQAREIEELKKDRDDWEKCARES